MQSCRNKSRVQLHYAAYYSTKFKLKFFQYKKIRKRRQATN